MSEQHGPTRQLVERAFTAHDAWPQDLYTDAIRAEADAHDARYAELVAAAEAILKLSSSIGRSLPPARAGRPGTRRQSS